MHSWLKQNFYSPICKISVIVWNMRETIFGSTPYITHLRAVMKYYVKIDYVITFYLNFNQYMWRRIRHFVFRILYFKIKVLN